MRRGMITAALLVAQSERGVALRLNLLRGSRSQGTPPSSSGDCPSDEDYESEYEPRNEAEKRLAVKLEGDAAHEERCNWFLNDWFLNDDSYAVRSAEKWVESCPESARAHNNLGNRLVDLGDDEGAAASFDRASELKPASERALATYYQNLGSALARMYRKEKDADAAFKAEAAFKAAIRSHPRRGTAHRKLGNLYAEMGMLEEAKAAREKAVELSAEQIRADPQDAKARGELYAALMTLDKFEGKLSQEAVAAYQRSLELDAPFVLKLTGDQAELPNDVRTRDLCRREQRRMRRLQEKLGN